MVEFRKKDYSKNRKKTEESINNTNILDGSKNKNHPNWFQNRNISTGSIPLNNIVDSSISHDYSTYCVNYNQTTTIPSRPFTYPDLLLTLLPRLGPCTAKQLVKFTEILFPDVIQSDEKAPIEDDKKDIVEENQKKILKKDERISIQNDTWMYKQKKEALHEIDSLVEQYSESKNQIPACSKIPHHTLVSNVRQILSKDPRFQKFRSGFTKELIWQCTEIRECTYVSHRWEMFKGIMDNVFDEDSTCHTKHDRNHERNSAIEIRNKNNYLENASKEDYKVKNQNESEMISSDHIFINNISKEEYKENISVNYEVNSSKDPGVNKIGNCKGNSTKEYKSMSTNFSNIIHSINSNIEQHDPINPNELECEPPSLSHNFHTLNRLLSLCYKYRIREQIFRSISKRTDKNHMVLEYLVEKILEKWNIMEEYKRHEMGAQEIDSNFYKKQQRNLKNSHFLGNQIYSICDNRNGNGFKNMLIAEYDRSGITDERQPRMMDRNPHLNDYHCNKSLIIEDVHSAYAQFLSFIDILLPLTGHDYQTFQSMIINHKKKCVKRILEKRGITMGLMERPRIGIEGRDIWADKQVHE